MRGWACPAARRLRPWPPPTGSSDAARPVQTSLRQRGAHAGAKGGRRGHHEQQSTVPTRHRTARFRGDAVWVGASSHAGLLMKRPIGCLFRVTVLTTMAFGATPSMAASATDNVVDTPVVHVHGTVVTLRAGDPSLRRWLMP